MSVLNVESAAPEAAQVTVVDGYVPVIDLSSARSGGAAERQLAR